MTSAGSPYETLAVRISVATGEHFFFVKKLSIYREVAFVFLFLNVKKLVCNLKSFIYIDCFGTITRNNAGKTTKTSLNRIAKEEP